jgi:hypothetical protein
MPSPFAALEALVNRAVREHLANAEATFGTATVYGLYRQTYAEELSGMAAGASLVFECEAADVPGIEYGSALSIAGTSYTVASVEPDGTGWMRLILQRASA